MLFPTCQLALPERKKIRLLVIFPAALVCGQARKKTLPRLYGRRRDAGLARAQRLVGPRSLGRGRMRQRDMLQRFEHRLDRPRQACLATQLSFLDAGR